LLHLTKTGALEKPDTAFRGTTRKTYLGFDFTRLEAGALLAEKHLKTWVLFRIARFSF
jgi:hypothetical protein